MATGVLISAAELRDRLEEIATLDCRYRLAEPEYGSNRFLESHIPGAFFMDLNDHLASKVGKTGGRHPLPDIDCLKERLEEAGISNDTEVVCYDDNLSGAGRCWFLLRYMGLSNVRVLNGGFQEWESGKFHTEKGKSFIGYGGSAPLGEEAVNSRAITRSLVFGLIIVGVVLTEVAYALTVGWGVSLMSSFAVAHIPGIIVATAYTGVAGGVMLSLVAFNSAFSDSVAMQSNAGRVYFAMGRDGVLPHYFAELHEKYVTPHKALIFIGTIASILSIGGTVMINALMGHSIFSLFDYGSSNSIVSNVLANSFDFLTTIALFGLIITHILLNTSVMTLFYRLKEKHHGIFIFVHITEHYVLPITATVIFAWVLYESIVPPVFPISEAVLASFGYLAFALLYAVRTVKLKPDVAARAGKSVNLVEEEKLEASN